MTLPFILIIIVFSSVLLIKLEAFQISSTSSTCALTDKENKATRIICPSNSIISNIHFASYGNPEGVCGNYTVGSCHATYSMNMVMNECLNKNKCSIIPSNDVFDLPAVDACHDLVTKLLFVEVSCKDNSSVNVSISSQISDIIPSISPTVSCQVGWIYYNANCYKFNVGYYFSWSGCKSQCTSLGASMLCIQDSTTNTWITNQISQQGFYYSWIGYSDLPNNDGNYKWVSGCSSSYTKYINNGYDCVYIYAYGGTWSSNYCDSGSSDLACSCEYSFAPTSIPTLSPTSPTSLPSLPPPTISPTVGCRVGWSYYDNNCYKFNVGTDMSWSGCKSLCASLGASMLCIPDSTTNTWIANQIYQQGSYRAWIGYSDLPNNDGNYEWVSGCSSSYSNSVYGNNYYYNDCVYIDSYNGIWYSSSDRGSLSSSIACSCEYPIAPTSLPTLSPTSPTVNPSTTVPSLPPPTISPNAFCESGWSYYNANCYKFNVGYYFSWSGCKSECASLGASMLCIPDSSTNSWIANQLFQLGYSNSWIGYSDLPNNDGNYEWVSGCSSSYSNSGYSNNYYYYDCVYIKYFGDWYSYYCDSFSIACSCEYSIAPTSLPTLSPTSPTVNPSTTVPSLPPPTISPNAFCESGWSYYNANCYKFNVGYYFSWSGCKSQCASLGASMLCIPDSSTNTWITNQISQQGYYYSWIGYSDLPNNDGNYEWVSGCSSSYSNSGYSNNYYYDCFFISSSGYWSSSSDGASFSPPMACSCQSLPTVPTTTRSNDNVSAIVGIVIGCVVFIIILFLILKYFFCKSPSNNDNIRSSDQAYTDIPPTCLYPPSDDDDDDDNDGVVPISSSTIELQVIVASDAYYNDVVPMDHEQELLPVAVQV